MNKKTLRKKGVTVVEMMIVIIIISTLFSLLYELMKSIQPAGVSNLDLRQLLDIGRKKAANNGKIISLHFNLVEKQITMTEYNPETESLKDNIFKSASENYDKNFTERAGTQEPADENEKKENENILSQPLDMPGNIDSFLSVTGVEFKEGVINFHFYPNGTSDSMIIKFHNEKNKYMLIPRFDTGVVFFSNLGDLTGNQP